VKPRLTPTPLTIEDREIMALMRVRWRYPLNRWYQYYDRGDADLMYRAVKWRWIVELNAIRPEAFHMWSDDGSQRIAFGGDLSADWYHEVQA
jgi:hypothetical protein